MAEKILPDELLKPESIVAYLENYLFSVPIQRRAAAMMQRLRAINILRTDFITPCYSVGRGPRLLLHKDVGHHLAVKCTLKRSNNALLDFHVHELIEMGAPPQITLRIVFAMLQVGLRLPSLVANHKNPWKAYNGLYRLNCCLGMLVHTEVRGSSVRQLRLSDLSLAARHASLAARHYLRFHFSPQDQIHSKRGSSAAMEFYQPRVCFIFLKLLAGHGQTEPLPLQTPWGRRVDSFTSPFRDQVFPWATSSIASELSDRGVFQGASFVRLIVHLKSILLAGMLRLGYERYAAQEDLVRADDERSPMCGGIFMHNLFKLDNFKQAAMECYEGPRDFELKQIL